MGIEKQERKESSNKKDYHITAKTQVLGIFGYPLAHALSPVMHNTAFRDMKLNYVYVGFSVTPSNLAHAIEGVRAMNMCGLSITVPHKVAIMQYLDEIDPLAKKIGAVNTVKNIDGKLYGRNTDGEGCLKGMKEAKVKLGGNHVVLLGAGGAARAVGMYLAREVETLTIVNRTASRLQELTTRLKAEYDIPITGILSHDTHNIRQSIGTADILINTTSVGMHPNVHSSPVDVSWLHEGLFVHDIIYNPLNTRLLQDASRIGCQTLSGVDMLVHQGILAFEWWTGMTPNLKLMKDVVIQHLAKKN